METVFFDIDGTLIDTAGAGSRSMVATLSTMLNIPIDVGSVSFSGRTDRSLVNELLVNHGMEDSDQFFASFCPQFVETLRETLPLRAGRVLPGVVELLEQLSQSGRIRMGLVTGNMRAAARVKLEHYGLSKYFYTTTKDPVGGFGDTYRDRNDVARSALAELHERIGSTSLGDDTIWVVGDTGSDIECGQAINAKVLAVETGRFGRDELSVFGPDLLLSDLTKAGDWVTSLLN